MRVQRSLLGVDLRVISRWRRSRRLQNAMTLGLVLLGPVLTAATFVVLGGPLQQAGASNLLRVVLLLDLVYIIIVAALVLGRVTRMMVARRNRSAGSQLHVRLTSIFVLLALIPTVLVAVFAVLSINLGFEGWFSERVQTVLGTSLRTAEAYESEEQREVLRDGQALAAYLNTERQTNFFMNDGDVRQSIQAVQNQIDRGLTEVFFIDSAGEIKTRGARSYDFNYERPTRAQFAEALDAGVLLIEDGANNEFRALIPLETFPDRFLLVTRSVDGEILSLLDETKQTVALYEQLEKDRGQVVVRLWGNLSGLCGHSDPGRDLAWTWFAERLSRPIGRLVSASQRVGTGDLDVQVLEDDGEDEIGQLGRNFNQMTTQLKAQREALLNSNRQSERRRRLFDSVLSSVTSGVVGLDADGRVTFVNPSAKRLLEVDETQSAQALAVAVPEFGLLFDKLVHDARPFVQEQVNLARLGQQESLLVRMAPRRTADGDIEGYVVAFDDVTDLVSAQRMAAWGDVARRIAHEIKNPLTPIRLSAERIARKFGAEVEDGEKLAQMTDVIVRQTEDLRRIVDEFSKFARMPEPELQNHDLVALVRDAVTLQEAGQPDVKMVFDLPQEPIMADIDSTMISQALTNLIKNAGEAIETLKEGAGQLAVAPEIRVTMTEQKNVARIVIEDNGIGLPEDRARLFEPYVTTRDKGTGLGLPIVKKIIEEHGGHLTLVDADIFEGQDRFGAAAIVELPIAPDVHTAKKIPA